MGPPFHPPPALPILYLGTHISGWMSAVQGLPGDKYVASGLSQVGVIPLIQEKYHVPHVAVHEVDTEGGPNRGPTQEVHHGERKLSSQPR